MKANKQTITVTVEVLSTDSVPHLLNKAAQQYSEEYHNGELVADDGDTVVWNTTSKTVTI